MEVRNELEHVKERDLRSKYGKAKVKYKGRIVMKDGVLKDTPLAREWWERKLKRKKVPSQKGPTPSLIRRRPRKQPRFVARDRSAGWWSNGIRVLEDGAL